VAESVPMPGTFTVAKVGDLRDGQAKVVDAGGTAIALIHARGTYRAFSNVCRHRGGPIGEGHVDLKEGVVICPFHGWQYDLETAKARLNPMAKLEVYEVEVVGEEIRVTV
jgi:nitrite reductase (NADH) small subunit